MAELDNAPSGATRWVFANKKPSKYGDVSMKVIPALICFLLLTQVTFGQSAIDLIEDADFVITSEEFGYLTGPSSVKMNNDSIIIAGDGRIDLYSRAGEYRQEYVPIVNEGKLRKGEDPTVDAFGNLAVFGFHDGVTYTESGQGLRGRAFVLNTVTGEQLLDLSFNHVEAGVPDSLWASTVSINDQYVAMGQPRRLSLSATLKVSE